MLYLSECQLLVIRNLDPLNKSKFEYNSNRWSNLHPDLKCAAQNYCDNDISREHVIESFKKYFDHKVGVELPFVLTMIWGFADTGYGTYRTNEYYTSENVKRMQSAFMHVKEENIQQAYKILKSIKGLNISYISKLLYFSTRALGHSDYFLIFDIRVARSLIRLSCPPTLVNLIDVKPSDKFEHYSQYNVQMHQLAQQHKVSAEALEMYLFLYDE